jgi:Domain of unknown function (DUF3576)
MIPFGVRRVKPIWYRVSSLTIASAAILGLAACGGLRHPMGGEGKKPAAVAEIGVNAYLWRASLDTLAFMPLASADPYGGVINTEWYINPEKPDERFKATVYILDSRLRADGVHVAVFREVNQGGTWVNATVSSQTPTDIENAILTRARQLRVSNLKG